MAEVLIEDYPILDMKLRFVTEGRLEKYFAQHN